MKTTSSAKSTNSITESKNHYLAANGDKEFLVQRCDFELFPLDKVVVDKRTDYQEVLIADTEKFGRVLFLDGDLQSSEYDEGLYHELLTQPALLAHEEPVNILVVGTGEGATLREIFKHKSASNVVAIDIDEEVVQLCKEYLPTWHQGRMEDPRVEHVFKDGFEYLKQTDKKFDVVIIDIVSDLDDGPANALYTPDFYNLVKNCMNENAIVAIQGLVLSHLDSESSGHIRLLKAVREVFQFVHSYNYSIPSFLSSWGFMLASDWFKDSSLNAQFFEERIAQKLTGTSLDFLSGETIMSAFNHDKKLAQMLDAGK